MRKDVRICRRAPRQTHNLKVIGSNPTPATTETDIPEMGMSVFPFSAPFPVHSRILPSDHPA